MTEKVPDTKKPERTVRQARVLVCKVEARGSAVPDPKEPGPTYVVIGKADSSQKAMAAIKRGEFGEGTFQVISVREDSLTMRAASQPVWEQS